MRTQLRTSSVRFLGVSAIVAALLNVAVLAQPNPDRSSLTLSVMDYLEIFVDRTEQSLKYIAPDDAVEEIAGEKALENLDIFADHSMNELKYSAPVEVEYEADQELQILAENMLEQLQYRAPVYDEFTNTFDRKAEMTTLKINTRPLVAEECSPQEAWLINAGYYKATRKPSFHKVRTVAMTHNEL